MKLKFKQLGSILFIASLYHASAYSRVNPADQNMINEQQKFILEQAQKQRESLKQSINIQSEDNQNIVTQSNLCFSINNILFKGVEHLSVKQQNELVSSYLGKCLNLNQIQLLVKSVNNFYISNGFITTTVYLDEQDVSTGTLIISVLEGRVADIYLDGKQPVMLKTVFPYIKGQVLNLRDIEQGLEQLNRLNSQKVSIQIIPAQQSGYSNIILESEKQRKLPILLDLGINNSGQKSTGTGQNVLNVSLENPLYLADIWHFSTSFNNDLRNKHASRSFSGQVSIPYGYWSFEYLYASNDFYYDIPLVFNTWRYKGKNHLHKIGLDRTLFRDNQSKLTFTTAYLNKNNKNTIADTKLAISSPTLNMLSVGVNYSTVLNDGYLTFNPSIIKGLHIFNTSKENYQVDGMPQSQFTKLTINSSYYKPLTSSLNYLTSIYAQWTEHNLYATERISIGGEYSVRGFKEDSLTGNQGLYWRNELNWQTTIHPVINTFMVTTALDTGWIKHQHHHIEGGNMTGVSLGFSITDNNYYKTAFSIGKPLFHPKTIHPDHWVSYFQISATF